VARSRKVGNCQLGVFLAYASERGHALVDMRLFLPKAWTDDPERCQAAGVPAGISYQTKAELGLALLRQVRATGQLEGQWVAGDDAYGMVPTLRDALEAEGWRYVLDVPTTTPCSPALPWSACPPGRVGDVGPRARAWLLMRRCRGQRRAWRPVCRPRLGRR